MKKINRKGDPKELLIELIIAVALIALIFFIVLKISERADDSTQEVLCRASVIIRGKASFALVDNLVEFEKITPLACHTTDLGVLKGSREEVKMTIADYSAKCWWQFAEGSVADLFKVDRKEKACFVCYRFSVRENMDDGIPSRLQIFTEPTLDERTGGNISSLEMTNYLSGGLYNPGIIYGGGSKFYFGQSFKHTINVGIGDDPRIIKPNKIDSRLVNGYVMDYSYLITEDTKNKINEIAVELQQAGAGNMLVIVADQFKSMENSDARIIIENTGLNSNDSTYDAILVLLDMKTQTVRVHLGIDQSVFIKEYEISKILEDDFEDAAKKVIEGDKQSAINAVNAALLESIEHVSDKLLNKQNVLEGINPKSYYYYITNGGYTWTMMSDITYPESYSIVYVAMSDEIGWEPSKVFTVVGGSLGVVTGVVLTATGVGAAIGAPMLIAGSTTVAGAYAGYKTGQAIPQEKIRPNNIMIVPSRSVTDQCTTTMEK